MKHCAILFMAVVLCSCTGAQRQYPVPQSAPVKARVERAAAATEQVYRSTVELRKAVPKALEKQARQTEAAAQHAVLELAAVRAEVEVYERQVQDQTRELQAASQRVLKAEKRIGQLARERDKALNKLWKWRAAAGGMGGLICLGLYLRFRP